MGLQVKVSFGMGTPSRIPWISTLGPGMTTSNGFYPVFLFYKKENILVLSYGISETTVPKNVWNNDIVNSSTKLSSFLYRPLRYGDSFLFKSYEPQVKKNSVKYFQNGEIIDHSVISKDLEKIISIYKECLNSSKENNIKHQKEGSLSKD